MLGHNYLGFLPQAPAERVVAGFLADPREPPDLGAPRWCGGRWTGGRTGARGRPRTGRWCWRKPATPNDTGRASRGSEIVP